MIFLHLVVWSSREVQTSDGVSFYREAPSIPFWCLPYLGVDSRVWQTCHCVGIFWRFFVQILGPIFVSLLQGVLAPVWEPRWLDPPFYWRKLRWLYFALFVVFGIVGWLDHLSRQKKLVRDGLFPRLSRNCRWFALPARFSSSSSASIFSLRLSLTFGPPAPPSEGHPEWWCPGFSRKTWFQGFLSFQLWTQGGSHISCLDCIPSRSSFCHLSPGCFLWHSGSQSWECCCEESERGWTTFCPAKEQDLGVDRAAESPSLLTCTLPHYFLSTSPHSLANLKKQKSGHSGPGCGRINLSKW